MKKALDVIQRKSNALHPFLLSDERQRRPCNAVAYPYCPSAPNDDRVEFGTSSIIGQFSPSHHPAKRAQRVLKFLIHDMRIDHRRPQARMPERLLHEPDVLRLPIEIR